MAARRRRMGHLVALAVAGVVFAPPLANALIPSSERSFDGVNLDELDPIEVTFTNEEDQLELAGMLFLPDGEGPFPGAAIIHGSGSSRRDNGWYLTLTDHLVREGIAVLLPDKRGSERSEGDWRTASFEALARDAAASIDFLDSHELVAADMVGVVGLSQGGRIAPLVAAQRDLTWIVSLVGGVLPAHDSLRYEETHNLRQAGFLPGVSDLLAWPASLSLIHLRDRDFWNAIGNFDPLPHWAQVEMPVLFQFGDDDTNVDTHGSVRRLTALDRPNLRIEVYEGSGHAIEDPPGQGNRIIRSDALVDLSTFIHDAVGSI